MFCSFHRAALIAPNHLSHFSCGKRNANCLFGRKFVNCNEKLLRYDYYAPRGNLALASQTMRKEKQIGLRVSWFV